MASRRKRLGIEVARSRKVAPGDRPHLGNGRWPIARARVVLLASRFNEPITTALAAGARATLVRHGMSPAHIQTYWVPGAFELPAAATALATTLKPHAIVALGCVIKGQTPQYAAIGQAVAQGLTQASVNTHIPVTFGVIIAESVAQARARAGGRLGNRGSEAAHAALAMIELLHRLAPRKRPGR